MNGTSGGKRRARPQNLTITQRLKVLVLGDAGVGKTSLIRRWSYVESESIPALAYERESWKFDPMCEPTVGVEFSKSVSPQLKTVDGKQMRIILCILDMSGDSSYCHVRGDFYEDFHTILFVFDLSQRSSFENLETWFNEVLQVNGDAARKTRCVVCGSKLDLSAQSRMVSEREARSWSQSKGFEYYESSAKLGANIRDVFNTLIAYGMASAKLGKAETYTYGGPTSASVSSPKPTNKNLHYDFDNMTVNDIKKELKSLGVDFSDCLEKSDLISRLVNHSDYLKQTYVSVVSCSTSMLEEKSQELSRKNQQMIDIINAEVEKWKQGKDIRSMLNDIHSLQPSSNGFLERQSNFALVQKAYKKALLKIHPDKQDPNNFEQHYRATEMFKALNAAFEAFQKASQKRMSGPDINSPISSSRR